MIKPWRYSSERSTWSPGGAPFYAHPNYMRAFCACEGFAVMALSDPDLERLATDDPTGYAVAEIERRRGLL